jgi:Fe-S-cluster containining protein
MKKKTMIRSAFCKNNLCMKCGRCCSSFGSALPLDAELDYRIRQKIYEKTSILYFNPIQNRLVLSAEEAEFFINDGKKKGINVKLAPNKVIYSGKDKIEIIDFVLCHDICPFLKDNLCTIYENRPRNCREFPEISSKEIKANGIMGCDFDSALKRAKQLLT